MPSSPPAPPLTGGGHAVVRSTADLATFPGNPRRGDVAVIADSLKINAQYRPIVVNAGTLTGRPDEVLAGNHTLLAARQLGWPTIQTWQIDVDEAAAKRIVLADNRTADLGSYDDRALTDMLSSLEDLDGTGFTGEELGKMLLELEPREGSADQFGDTEDLEVENQFGVIVMCDSEADQALVYDELVAGPRPVRVVTV